MRRAVIVLSLAVVVILLSVTASNLAVGQEPDKGTPVPAPKGASGPLTETDGENIRTVSDPSAPAGSSIIPSISFIDSPTPSCIQPDPAQNVCYVNYYYLSVNANPNYMIAMTVTLASKVRAVHGGFFQTSMYVPYNMNGQGFKVACGAAGAGGNPDLGNAYSYTINARDSANLKSANYGTVYCPPFP